MSTPEIEDTILTENIPIIEITENGIEGFDILCRLCANRSDHLIPIYSEEGISNDLPNKMNLYLPVKVSETDTLPLQCCFQCATTVLTWHELVIASVEADRRLRDLQIEAEKHFQEQSINLAQESLEVDEKTEIKADSDDDRFAKYQLTLSESDTTLTETHESTTSTIIKKISTPIWRYPFKEAEKNSVIISPSKSKNIQPVNVSIKIEESEENIDSTDLSAEQNNSEKLKKVKCVRKEKKKPRKRKVKKNEKCEITNGIRKRRTKEEIIYTAKCDICSKQFTRKHDMLKHRQRLHEDAPPIIDQTKSEARLDVLKKCQIIEEGQISYKCNYCQKYYASNENNVKYRFLRHHGTHTINDEEKTKKNYFCEVCGKGFRVLGQVKRHIKECHDNIKEHSCEYCGRNFKNKQTLSEHINIHTNERPFSCNTCGKSFKQKASLYHHKLFHNDIFKFPCTICGKKFRRASSLKVHNFLHTGQRPHSCEICGSTFTLIDTLRKHMYVHSNESFKCDLCSACFTQERYLKRHTKKAHIIKREGDIL